MTAAELTALKALFRKYIKTVPGGPAGLTGGTRGVGMLTVLNALAEAIAAAGSATPGTSTAIPFGPLKATGAAGETFELPAGTQSLRGVQLFNTVTGPGQFPAVPLLSNMYALDTVASPPTLTVLLPAQLNQGDTIEGIAFTTGSPATPGPGGIIVGGTIGTPGILVISTSNY